MTPAPFTLRYLRRPAFDALSDADRAGILGVIGYGVTRPERLHRDCPFAASGFTPIGQDAAFEIWSSPGPVRYEKRGRIAAALAEAVTFGVLEVTERPDEPLEIAVRDAYLEILGFLAEIGHATPIRFWNYLPDITADQQGLERYRRFNIGRHDAFSAALGLPLPPVASGVGTRTGTPLIYFLAAPDAALTIENPRQVSAYDYPTVYGPRSPRFSRAAIHGRDDAPCLMISGTASIVGHESLHRGDPAAQIGETFANLDALVGEARRLGFPQGPGGWACKIYLRDPVLESAVAARIDEAFGPDCDRVYLAADICRPELLLEIEAFCRPDIRHTAP